MRFRIDTLMGHASDLMQAAGLAADHAREVARSLVEADCFGHHTHGLALLPRYLDEMAAGQTTMTGSPSILRDGGSTLLVDGLMLPGPAVMAWAVGQGLSRLDGHGLVSVVIRDSKHIACLATYLEAATSRGKFILIVSSNPGARVVAPFGARRAVYSPNPIACGIPTTGDPILVDFSLSGVAANACREKAERGEMLGGNYLVTATGELTNDPKAFFADPPAALTPLGGADLGHKGFGFGLIIEALTSALAGGGRSDPGVKNANAVFILLVDPDAFAGDSAFARETGWLAQACRAAGEDDSVRMPGERALSLRCAARKDGIALAADVAKALAARATRLGVAPLSVDGG